MAQGGESFDFAQDREPVERLVEPFGIWYLCFGISGLSGLGDFIMKEIDARGLA